MSMDNGSLEDILTSDVQVSGIDIKVSAPGKVILHGEHSVVYGKLAVAAALGLRSSLRLVETQSNNYLTVSFPHIGFTHKYSLEKINSYLDMPLPVSDAKDFNWEYPEKIQHDELLSKVDDFIASNLITGRISPQNITSQKAFFYLLFGILGSVDIQLPSIVIFGSTELQIGAGTGSSASFLVSLSALLVQYVKIRKTSGNFSKPVYKPSSWEVNLKEFNRKELDIICKWAFNGEKIIHGTPSGIDNTICTYGTMVKFRKGAPVELIPTNTTLQILLISSKIPRETKTLVAKLLEVHRAFPNIVNNIFNALEDIAVTASQKIRALPAVQEVTSEERKKEITNIYKDLGILTTMNHNLLSSLGVSHPRLEEIITIVSEHGLNGKLTGAGGGGYAVALVPPFFNKSLLENVQKVLISKGFDVSCVTVGGKGVAVE